MREGNAKKKKKKKNRNGEMNVKNKRGRKREGKNEEEKEKWMKRVEKDRWKYKERKEINDICRVTEKVKRKQKPLWCIQLSDKLNKSFHHYCHWWKLYSLLCCLVTEHNLTMRISDFTAVSSFTRNNLYFELGFNTKGKSLEEKVQQILKSPPPFFK